MTINRIPGPFPVVVWRWDRGESDATTQARTAIRGALEQLGYGAGVIDDVIICVSEFVANAVEHAMGPYEIRLRTSGDEVVCEVEDHDPSIPRVPPFIVGGSLYETEEQHRGGGLEALTSVLAERGRGLPIVHALTNGAWGFSATEATKTAWLIIPGAPGE